ncbi:hypothetical protein JCM16358_05780 [Halanaerocella petrolearia]
MRKYIGILSVVYILISIFKLKDTNKSFQKYREEFKDMKKELQVVSETKNPFVMMKFTSSIFYFFLILYYVANIVLFNNYPFLDIVSYILILVGLFKLSRKLLINSVDDFEEMIEVDQQNYHRKRKFNFALGLIEFAYAFNALSLISLYY